MNPNDLAVRKRTRITQANRTMFIWIAVASAVVGVAIVVSIFLGQKLIYNEKVLARKLDTVSTLDHNLSVVDQLKQDVQALSANSALGSVKANETDEPLQVVLDALPSEANSLALGASLQNKLLAGVQSGFSIESLSVTPVSGVESLDGSDTSSDEESASNQINFSFTVKGDQAALKQILENLQRSIRTIVVSSASIEVLEGGLSLSVNGHAFYEPAKTIELKEETVSAK
jgi:hypothetical protein